MSDVPLIKIPIDSSEFDQFLDKYEKYQASLKEQPSQWHATSEEVGGLKSAFEQSLQSFEHLNTLAGSSKLVGQSSFIAGFTKASTASEKSWGRISKDVEKTSKGLSRIERMAIKIGAAGTNLLGGAVGVGAAVFGATVTTANDVAAKNAQNRALGLAPGEAASFDAHYKKMGGDDALLAKISAAKHDITMQVGLRRAGLTQDEINTKSPTDLAAEFLENAGSRFKSYGAMGGRWADANKVTDFADVQTLNQASTYSHDDYQRTHNDYQADVPRLALKQKEMDEGTAASEKLNVAFDEAKTSLEQTFVTLAPELSTFAKGVADSIDAYSKSGELRGDIDQVIIGMKDLAAASRATVDGLNILNGGKNVTPAQQANGDNPSLRGGSFAAKTYGAFTDWYDALKGNAHAPTDVSKDILFRWSWNQQAKGTTAAPQQKATSNSAWVQQALPVVSDIESKGNPRAENPVTHARGAYQLMPATADQYHVDPYDPVASREVAGKILNKNLDQYDGDRGKALAAYDGDTHIAADAKKLGADNWVRGAKPETQEYLYSAIHRGLDTGLSAQNQQWLEQQHVSRELAKHVKSLRPAPTADQDNGGPMFHMPQSKQSHQSLPITNISVNVPAGSSVQTSIGGMTA